MGSIGIYATLTLGSVPTIIETAKVWPDFNSMEVLYARDSIHHPDTLFASLELFNSKETRFKTFYWIGHFSLADISFLGGGEDLAYQM